MKIRRKTRVTLILACLTLLTIGFPRLLSSEVPITYSAKTEVLFDEIQRRGLNYFLKEQHPQTGLIRDWAWNGGGGSNSPATIAGTGFALTAYGVGVERGWLSLDDAKNVVKRTLRFLLNDAPHENGFFYHFLTFDKGVRVRGTELSPIDTALAIAGILFVSEYFEDAEIKSLADQIYDRVDWNWMLNGGKTFAMAWTPERGFYKNRWAGYDESTMMYLLALGSRTHPIPEESWKAVNRKVGSYKDYRLMKCPPLFTHQYPHIWFDFRNKNDGYADYFENSRRATLAQRQFAIDQSDKHKSYGPNSWGFTAAQGPYGYKAYGAPPGQAKHDGTVVPTACGASVPFAPEETIACLTHFKEEHGDDLWGPYGFSDAFNLDLDWFSNQAFAINQGPMVLMIENYRSELIWNVMNKIPAVQRAFEKAGFQQGTIELTWQEPESARAVQLNQTIEIDGDLSDWPLKSDLIRLNGQSLEYGELENSEDLSATIRFAWDDKQLYFTANVRDESLVFRSKRDLIYRDDVVEFFVDPDGDGLFWNSKKDFQIGVRPNVEADGVSAWTWFPNKSDPSRSENFRAAGRLTDQGYMLEGAIKWSYLGVDLNSRSEVRLSVAIHDMDRDRSESKLNWFFRGEEDMGRHELGRLILQKQQE